MTTLTAMEEEAAQAAVRFERASAQEVLEWGLRRYTPGIALACSFGGASGMALLDMAARIGAPFEVFYLDTDLLFPETYALIEQVRTRYGVEPVAYRSRWTLEAQEREFAPNLWESDPDMCCSLRKVEPNARALEGKQAWIAGLRRDQAATRANINKVEWDRKFELVKLNPLADWTEDDVWRYVRAEGVPYNALHDKGYASIGCVHCTRPSSAADGDLRAGRWAGFDKTECGLHTDGPLQLPISK